MAKNPFVYAYLRLLWQARVCLCLCLGVSDWALELISAHQQYEEESHPVEAAKHAGKLEWDLFSLPDSVCASEYECLGLTACVGVNVTESASVYTVCVKPAMRGVNVHCTFLLGNAPLITRKEPANAISAKLSRASLTRPPMNPLKLVQKCLNMTHHSDVRVGLKGKKNKWKCRRKCQREPRLLRCWYMTANTSTASKCEIVSPIAHCKVKYEHPLDVVYERHKISPVFANFFPFIILHSRVWAGFPLDLSASLSKWESLVKKHPQRTPGWRRPAEEEEEA